MKVYYNEFDNRIAAWLEELLEVGLLPHGFVDTRDVREVKPSDLECYAQCHFFAGIGGWPLALRLAGCPDNVSVWTGSPPCQPFSAAGKQKGKEDERHLAPKFIELIAEGQPLFVFGEQVATAVKKDEWLDDLQDELEALGYTTGAVVVPACGVQAPHIRQRLYFSAVRLGDSRIKGLEGYYRHVSGSEGRKASQAGPASKAGCSGALADHIGNEQWQGRGAGCETEARDESRAFSGGLSASDLWTGIADEMAGQWDSVDWVHCRDGKWRPTESSIQWLADGLSESVVRSGPFVPASFPLSEKHKEDRRQMRLHGYGNAIVPQLAAEVIKSTVEFVGEEMGW